MIIYLRLICVIACCLILSNKCFSQDSTVIRIQGGLGSIFHYKSDDGSRGNTFSYNVNAVGGIRLKKNVMLDCFGEMMFLDKNGNFMWNFSLGLVFNMKGNELFVKGGYSEEDAKNAAGVIGVGYGMNVSKKNNKLVFVFNYNTRNMYSVGVAYDLFRLRF